MKKLVVLFATVVLAFSMSFAQTGGDKKAASTDKKAAASTDKKAAATTDTKSDKKSAKKAGANTITGCLAKSDAGYTIANGNYKNGLPVTTDKDISAHVGHKVQLTGTLNKEGGKAKSFTATDMKHIAPTCTVPGAKGGEKKAGQKKGGDKKGGATSTPK